MIDPHAIVSSRAQLDESVRVGPFAVIGPDVVIGAHTTVGAHAVIEGPTHIGQDNQISQFASIGSAPQDKKYNGEPTQLTSAIAMCFVSSARSIAARPRGAASPALVRIACSWPTPMLRMTATSAAR